MFDSDTDGDGIFDDFEQNGIPYTDAAGNPQRYPLPGANYQHKDLFVEVDSMTGLRLGTSAKAMVEGAFANAPTPEITNPDGRPGIALHIIEDDQNLPFEAVSELVGVNFPRSAPALKAQWFGTAADRGPNLQAIQRAKSQVFRYCLAINSVTSNLYGGLAELHGDDMVICIGGLSDEDKASVFMHELGHTLGLQHGGGDGINGKPNYPSIMNYILAYRENRTYWRLDYSRCAMPDLNEDDLDETRLFTGSDHDCGLYRDFVMPISVLPVTTCWGTPTGIPTMSHVFLDGASPTDYNGNCNQSDRHVMGQDLNYLVSAAAVGQSVQHSFHETLTGYDDWQHITLPITANTGNFADRVPPDELSGDGRARLQQLIATLPTSRCIADVDDGTGTGHRDGGVTIDDLLYYLGLYAAGDVLADVDNGSSTGHRDGGVTIDDLLYYLQRFEAGC